MYSREQWRQGFFARMFRPASYAWNTLKLPRFPSAWMSAKVVQTSRLTRTDRRSPGRITRMRPHDGRRSRGCVKLRNTVRSTAPSR
jgi:hypothetical protein